MRCFETCFERTVARAITPKEQHWRPPFRQDGIGILRNEKCCNIDTRSCRNPLANARQLQPTFKTKSRKCQVLNLFYLSLFSTASTYILERWFHYFFPDISQTSKWFEISHQVQSLSKFRYVNLHRNHCPESLRTTKAYAGELANMSSPGN